MTIEQRTVDGRQATVCYLNSDFDPAERADATMAKIIYDDGDVAFINFDEDKNALRTQRQT